jgi:hypothetical protein
MEDQILLCTNCIEIKEWIAKIKLLGLSFRFI